jgi:hypothetical protein
VPNPSAFTHRAPFRIQPAVKVLGYGEMLAINDESLIPISDSLSQLSSHISTGFAVNVPTFSTNFVLTYPRAIFAAVDASLFPTSSSSSHNDTSVGCVGAVKQLNSSLPRWYIHHPTGD